MFTRTLDFLFINKKFYFLAGCCEKILINHEESVTIVYQAFPVIFQLYELEIENTTINGRAHYTSDDGNIAIWYGSCGYWVVGLPDYRYPHLHLLH